MIINRQDLTDRIYRRFNGAIPKLVLYDALQAICDALSEKIIKNQSVAIHNFGIFHKYEFSSRKTADVNSGEIRNTKAFINVGFVPDKVLVDLINEKRLFFNQID